MNNYQLRTLSIWHYYVRKFASGQEEESENFVMIDSMSSQCQEPHNRITINHFHFHQIFRKTGTLWSIYISGRQWGTGRPSLLQSMGLQRVGHDLAADQQQKHDQWVILNEAKVLYLWSSKEKFLFQRPQIRGLKRSTSPVRWQIIGFTMESDELRVGKKFKELYNLVPCLQVENYQRLIQFGKISSMVL